MEESFNGATSLTLCVSLYSDDTKCHDYTDSTLDVSTTAGTTLNRKYPSHLDGGDPTKAVKGGSEQHLEQRKRKLEKEEHALHVIVASEPTTFRRGEWTLLDKNHILMVDETMHPVVEELKV